MEYPLGAGKVFCSGGSYFSHLPKKISAADHAVPALFYGGDLSVSLYHEYGNQWNPVFPGIPISSGAALSAGNGSDPAQGTCLSPIPPEECFTSERAVFCRGDDPGLCWMSAGGLPGDEIAALGNLHNFQSIITKLLYELAIHDKMVLVS